MKKIFSSLIKATSLLSSSFNLKRILPEAMHIMETLMRCEASSIMLLDEKGENLVFEVALGEKGKAVKKLKLPVGKGIAGKVAQNGKPLIVYDTYKDKRFHKQFDKMSGFKTRSIICVPLRVQNKIIGVAEVLNPIGREKFKDEDVHILSIFANQVALSIETARLHKEILEQKRLEDELKFAKSIQESFLPSHLPQSKFFSLYALTKPARIIGGDFYDAITANNKTFLFVGDVCGKGAGAALFMASFISKLRLIIQNTTDLNKIINSLNSLLCKENPTGLFVTLIGVCIEGKNVFCINAGHPDPVLYTSQKKKAYRVFLPQKNMPLGIMENAHYSCDKIITRKNDILLLFSDGVIETKNNKSDLFSYKPLLRYRGYTKLPHHIAEDILKKIYRFKGKVEQFDDITLMVIKIQ